jgi:hypothetical protein
LERGLPLPLTIDASLNLAGGVVQTKRDGFRQTTPVFGIGGGLGVGTPLGENVDVNLRFQHVQNLVGRSVQPSATSFAAGVRVSF